MAERSFTKEQVMAVSSRGGNLLVAAAAGSGKTHVLVSRLMSYICEENRDIDEFLVITYTRAAAAELRARILSEINKRLKSAPSRHLMRQQTLIHRAKINTIHAFCQGVLRENAHLAGISPDFRIAESGEAEILVHDALERVLNERYDTIESRKAFRALADTMGAGRDDSALCEMIMQTRSAMLSHPYPDEWGKTCAAQWETQNVSDAKETAWGEFVLYCEKCSVSYWEEQMRRALDTIYQYPAMAKAYGESFEESLSALQALRSAIDISWDKASEKSVVPFPRLGGLRNFEDKATAESIKDVRERCRKAMAKTADRLCAKTAELLSDMEELGPVMRELFAVVDALENELWSEKTRRNVLDFSDLEHIALRILVDKESGGPTETAKSIRGRFHEIMVDEYQDVNKVQDMIFTAVSTGQNVFMVGDVKQSIYRFRLADPTIFLEKYKSYSDLPEAASGRPGRVLLSKNFRSRAGVLDAVNFVFRALMSENFGEMEYTEREALYPGAEYPEKSETCMELLVLDAMNSEDEGRRLLEARMAAARVKELLNSGMTVSEGGSERPIRCSDIMLLLRSLKGRAEIYTAALSELGIPVASDKKTGFFQTVEITVILSLLSVIDNPHQDVPLISALRSPLFGFTANELAFIRAEDKSGDMYDALKARAEGDSHCESFLSWLQKFRLIAADMSADELIWRLYIETGALAVFGAMEQGSGREANLMQLYEYARSYVSYGDVGLFGFMRYIGKLMEQGREPELPLSSLPLNAVTVTSIHKSKGLEAPVVLLCDTAALFNAEDTRKPLLIHSKLGAGPWRTDLKRRIKYPTVARMAVSEKLRREMLSEELRVLYVAMTRAREKLIVTCSYNNVQREIVRISKTASVPANPQALCECRSMADWLLAVALCRADAQALREASDTPLPLAETENSWSVRLCLPGEKSAQRQEESEENEKKRIFSESKLNELHDKLTFTYKYETAALIPSKITATELKSSSLFELEAAEGAQPLPEQPKDDQNFRVPDFAPERPLTSAEKGVAAHLAMQYINYSKCTDLSGVEEELRRMESAHLLTKKQAQSVNIGQIVKLFTSPLGRRILAASNVMREFKFSLLKDAGSYFPGARGEEILLQGVVDCCIEEHGELTVIDYKTDFVGKEGAETHAGRYLAQLEAYAGALEEICKKKVREKIVYFLRTGESVVIFAKS